MLQGNVNATGSRFQQEVGALETSLMPRLQMPAQNESIPNGSSSQVQIKAQKLIYILTIFPRHLSFMRKSSLA